MKLMPYRFLIALLLCLFIAGCSKQSASGPPKGTGKQRMAAGVRVAKAQRKDMAFELRAIGNVEAWSSVAIKSRVAGQLLKVHVRDGAEVKEGDLLFEIDPAPFIESLRAAEAALARDAAAEKQAQASIARTQAQVANARAQADRYTALFKEGVGAKEQVDEFTTAAEAQGAQLNADRAALESTRAALKADEARLAEAKLQLSYTKIHAPSSGRAGFVGIKAGNLVKENDTTPLVTILQIVPVWVTFSVPEQNLNEIRKASVGSKLPVQVVDDESGAQQAAGYLDVVDNAVDPATGTIKLKARFENRGRELWPGQFVTVLARVRVDRNVLTVPNSAVQDGPDGRYVWVMTPQGTADMKPVKVARVQGGDAVLTEGLDGGETVVTFGQLGVRKGSPLRILDAGSAASGRTGE